MDWLASYTTGGQTSSYGYNGDGVRTQSTKAGATTRYLIDPAAALPNVTAECDDANSPQRFYIHGLGLLASIDTSNTVQTYHANHRGDVLALTNSSGTVTESYGYSPFGLTSASNPSSTNPFRFGGALGVMDEGNGLNFMRARYYTASAGRFISMDQLAGGFKNSQTLDRFAYALGNPMSNADPSGHKAKTAKEQLADVLKNMYLLDANKANNAANYLISNGFLDSDEYFDNGLATGIAESSVYDYILSTSSLSNISYFSTYNALTKGKDMYNKIQAFLGLTLIGGNIYNITQTAIFSGYSDLLNGVKIGDGSISQYIDYHTTTKGGAALVNLLRSDEARYNMEQLFYQIAVEEGKSQDELDVLKKGMLIINTKKKHWWQKNT
jgi:RHS repeat-associated protein